jgi:hypothetical protein
VRANFVSVVHLNVVLFTTVFGFFLVVCVLFLLAGMRVLYVCSHYYCLVQRVYQSASRFPRRFREKSGGNLELPPTKLEGWLM